MRGVAIGLVMAWAGVARAAPPPAIAIDLGFPIGALEVADQGGLVGAGFHGGLGVPAGPLLVELGADWSAWFGGADGPMSRVGAGDRALSRGTAALRWDYGSYRGPGATLVFFADAGLGWERLARTGVIADRPELDAGLGLEEDLGRGQRRGGVLIAVRVIAAPITAAAARFACDPSCPPSGRRGTDLGFVFWIGGTFRD